MRTVRERVRRAVHEHDVWAECRVVRRARDVDAIVAEACGHASGHLCACGSGYARAMRAAVLHMQVLSAFTPARR